jgi:arabinose-5-phosphate isomerase
MSASFSTYYANAIATFEAQIAALRRAQSQIEPHFSPAVALILEAVQKKGKVVVTGVGKSGIIAHKISATLASTGTPSVFLNASEALHGDLGMVSQGDVVLMLSKSGTTLELIKMIPTLQRVGAKTIGIFGNIHTRLSESLDLVLDGSVEREACPLNLAPTSSTTVALVIGDALAIALMQAQNFRPADFALYHPAGQLGRNLLLTAADVMHKGEKLPLIDRKATLKSAVLMLTQKNLGALCVCNQKNELEGILTDGDIRRWLTKSDKLDEKVENLMTTAPTTVAPTDTLAQVIAVMENPNKQIYTVPVVEGKICVGLVRMHDILQQ